MDSDYIAHLDGYSVIEGGWLNHHWVQLGYVAVISFKKKNQVPRYPRTLANVFNSYQIADSVAGFAYAFGGTCIILFVMNLIPGLSLRASEEAEILGIDDAELGEFAVCISCGVWLCSSKTDFLVYSTITLNLPARSFPRTIQHRNSPPKQAPHPDYIRVIVLRNPRVLDPRLLPELFYPCFVVVVLFSVEVVFLVSSGAFGGVCSRDWHGTKCWLDWGHILSQVRSYAEFHNIIQGFQYVAFTEYHSKPLC